MKREKLLIGAEAMTKLSEHIKKLQPTMVTVAQLLNNRKRVMI